LATVADAAAAAAAAVAAISARDGGEAARIRDVSHQRTDWSSLPETRTPGAVQPTLSTRPVWPRALDTAAPPSSRSQTWMGGKKKRERKKLQFE
jgi:hypothetical protein